jgi:hypothetical protein
MPQLLQDGAAVERGQHGLRNNHGLVLQPQLLGGLQLHTSQQHPTLTERWQKQVHNWSTVAHRFGISMDRYDVFKYLCFLDIYDEYITNYVRYHLGIEKPIIKGRLAAHS